MKFVLIAVLFLPHSVQLSHYKNLTQEECDQLKIDVMSKDKNVKAKCYQQEQTENE
jgi:hypothetical protein